MRWSVALVAILVAACAEDALPGLDTDPSSCTGLPPATSSLLDELVGHDWEGNDCDLFGPCNLLRFQPDGVFEHGADVRGRWYATGDRSHGLLFTDSGSTYALSFDAGLLTLGGTQYGYGSATGATANSTPPPLSAPPLLCTLTETSWKKSSPFDDFRRPENLRFDADGAFEAAYRSGCTHLGSYSIRENTSVRLTSELNDCGLAEGGSFSASLVDFQAVPLFVDGTLMLGEATYQPDDGVHRDDTLIFDGPLGLRTVVSTRDFEAPGPLEITVEIHNLAEEVTRGVRFEVAQRLPGGGVSSLVSRVDAGALPGNGSRTFQATMEMPVGSVVELEFMSAPLAFEGWAPYRVRYEP
ncbi:MAG: hypothetical protein ACRBN8_30435 [Nannocystales bacterium]